MNPEVKALKDVVEHFGSMIAKLQRDYALFKDWIDRVTETDQFLKASEQTQVSNVEVTHTVMNVTKNNTTEELKNKLGALETFGIFDENKSEDEFNPDEFL